MIDEPMNRRIIQPVKKKKRRELIQGVENQKYSQTVRHWFGSVKSRKNDVAFIVGMTKVTQKMSSGSAPGPDNSSNYRLR